MKLFQKISLKQIIPTLILAIILVWSILIQFVLTSQFDQAKAAVARWPQLSQPHLWLSLALYQTGSVGFEKELARAKQSLAKNQALIQKIESIVSRPKQTEEQIKYWSSFSQKGVESAEANRHLSLLYWQKQENDKAQDYFKKAFWLDPNNEITEEIRKIINQ